MTQEQIAVRISTVALIAALAMMFALALAGCAPANQCQTIESCIEKVTDV